MPGQLSSSFPIDPRDPEGSVPGLRERNANPVEFGYFLQDLLEQAEQSRKRNDLAALVQFYRAVAKAVPENARGWSKLCEAYELAGDRERAIRSCRYALERPAVEFQDYARYIHLVLAKQGPLPAGEQAALDEVIEHLATQPGLDTQVNHFRCEVGVKLKDVPRLEACTRALARVAPNDPKTVVFLWSLAVQKGERAEAERLVGQAVKAGVVLGNVERMREVTAGIGGGRRTRLLSWTLGLAFLLALAAVALRRRLVPGLRPRRP